MELTEKHCTLMAGIAIKRSGAGAGLGTPSRPNYGTLTAVARRKGDLKKVLVTNLHVVSNAGISDYHTMTGTESVYHLEVSDANKVGTVYVKNEKNSWLSVGPDGATSIDLAALLVENAGEESEIDTYLGVHKHGVSDAIHDLRPIVQPVKEPEDEDFLTFIGATSDMGMVRVEDASTMFQYDAPGVDKETGLAIDVPYAYNNVVYINRSEHPGYRGDSGAPLLWEDPDGNYHLCCIHFSSAFNDDDTRDPTHSYAIPASVAERELGVTFGIKAPVAVSGDPGTVRPGQRFQLDGSGSQRGEPDASITLYKWEELFGDDSASAVFSSSTYRDFTAPSIAGYYQYKLTVEDTNKARHSVTVTVTVNNPPSANVAQEVVTAFRGDTVELNGSGSSDPDGHSLTYSWVQTGVEDQSDVPTVTITNSDEARASFVAPDYIGRLSFSLTVTDEMGATDSAEVYVTVRNRSPIAHAGPNRVINANNPVTLEGSVDDPDPIDRNYVTDNHTWTQDSGPKTITLDPVADEPVHRTFTPDVVGEYFFTLTATDKEPLSDSDTVRVSVWPSSQNLLPTRVMATPSARSVDISWDELSIATGYEVVIGIPASAGGLGHTSHTTTGTSITIPSLIPQKTYEYRVRMTNAEGVGPWTAWATVVTPGETPPTPTADQWDVRQLNNKIQVKVTELPEVIPAVSQVKAILSIDEELGPTTVEKDVGTILNEWVDVLTSSETDWRTGRWFAQIRFVNTSSSLYSLGKSVTVVSAPANVMATPSTRSMDVTWNRVTGADDYNVEIGETGQVATTIHSTSDTSITIPSLTPRKSYRYRVQATNSDGVGPWTAWARVATPGETPPVPTAGQWSVRYRNNRIQVKVMELPATTPAIDQVKAKLGISPLGTGLGSDTITVTRDIGTRLNRWVNVLTDADAEWQMGMWTAQVRFENTVGDPRYSAGKTVVVTPPNNPPAANAGYHQVARTNTRVNLTDASASDPDGADQEGLTYSWIRRSGPFVLLNNANSLSPWFMTPRTTSTLKFRLRVTDPQGARDSDDVTIRVFAGATSSWYDTREEDGCGPTKRKRQTRLFKGKIEKQWVSTPEEAIWTAWADTDETRNEDIGDWTNTGRTRENPVTIIVENEQTRTITWEKEQERTNQCDQSETQWVPASRTETQWVADCTWVDVSPPETRNRIEGAWTDTGRTRENPVTLVVEKEQTRTITWEKKQQCTSDGTTHYQWADASRTETRWVADCTWVDVSPSETRNNAFGLWLDSSETRNRVVGNWARTGSVRENPVTLLVEEERERTITWEKKQNRTQTWQKKQECVSHGSTETRWVDASGSQTRWIAQSTTETQWVACTLPDTDWSDAGPTRVSSYGTWTRTGQTRGSGANRECKETRTNAREKKQTRTRNCGTETQWVPTTSATQTRWVSCPEPEPCGPWSDTGNTRTSYGTYSRTGATRGSGSSRECEESRTNATEKEQQRTCDNIIENRWVSTGTTTQTRWVGCPVSDPDPWGPWTDTGERRVDRYGSWTATGRSRENQILLIVENEEQRTVYWEKQQERTSQSGNRSETQWVSDGTSTQTRWVYHSDVG